MMIFLVNEEEKIIVHMILIYIINYLALGEIVRRVNCEPICSKEKAA